MTATKPTGTAPSFRTHKRRKHSFLGVQRCITCGTRLDTNHQRSRTWCPSNPRHIDLSYYTPAKESKPTKVYDHNAKTERPYQYA
ncbi:MAG: hypothetical protein AAGJ10_13830 [Bacteroidota bacterium]